MLLKTPIRVLICKAALKLVRVLLNARKAKYVVRLLGLLKTYSIIQLLLIILRHRDIYAQPRK
jgi:hypothetical protein